MFDKELKRAIGDRKTWGLLVFGILLVIAYFVQYTLDFAYRNCLLMEHDFPMVCPTTVYEGWIGSGTFSLQSFLYYMILPLLVAGSYADSLYTERKSGYLKNILLRIDFKNYVVGKLFAVFFVSGVVFTFPLIISFLLAATVLPNHMPELTCAVTLIRGTSFMGALYYSHPMVYTCIWWMIDFVYAGLVGCVAMLYAFYVEHRFYLYAVPFIIWMFINSIFGIFHLEGCSPIYFLNPGFGYAKKEAVVVYAGVLILTIGTEYIIGKNREIL